MNNLAIKSVLVFAVFLMFFSASIVLAQEVETHTLEAENMVVKTTGEATTGGWTMWSNGSIEDSETFTGGLYSVEITASGSVAAGVWSNMELRVNQSTLLNFDVNSTNAVVYSGEINIAAGSQNIAIAFINDYFNETEDRNLFIDKIVLRKLPQEVYLLEAEQMSVKTTGSASTSGWNLFSNGYIEETTQLTAGVYEFEIMAKGLMAGGSWPKLELRIDQNTKATFDVNSESLSTFKGSISVAEGSYAIAIAFINDYFNQTGDRNVFIDKIVLKKVPTQKVWFEAEEAESLVTPIVIATDIAASLGNYIYAPEGSGQYLETVPFVMATYKVNIPKDGIYYLWGKVVAVDGGQDSFYIQADNGPDNLWDIQIVSDGSWNWDVVSNRNGEDPVSFNLTSGEHTIKVKIRDDGAKLDRLLLTNDISYVPGGIDSFVQVGTNYVYFEAENMSIKTTGGPTTGGWNLWSNGYIEDIAVFASPGTYKLEVTARGSISAGVWPNMDILIDQTKVTYFDVNSTVWSLYTGEIEITEGSHDIAVKFTNDYYNETGDRNLFIDKIALTKKTADITLPSAPANLTAEVISNNQINLSWDAAIDDTSVVGYKIYRDNTEIATTTATTYSDLNLDTNTLYKYRVSAYDAAAHESYKSNEVAISIEAAITFDPNVVWTDIVGVVADGNNLTKTAYTAWGNGGAASITNFSGNGGAQFTVTETNTHRMFGLSRINADADYQTIDYAIYLFGAGPVYVMTNGADVSGQITTYQAGDIFAVVRDGTSILFKKNGITFFTLANTVTNEESLLVDVALQAIGSTITDVKFIGVTPAVPSIINDLTADATHNEVSLSWSEPSGNGFEITQYRIEYGTVAGSEFDHTVFVAQPGAVISGLTDFVEYQFRVTAKNALGSSQNSNVATAIPNDLFSKDVVWKDTVGVTVNGNSLTKNTSASTWGDSGAASVQSFTGNGGARFMVAESTTRMFGLSRTNVNASGETIEYAFLPQANRVLYIQESGVQVSQSWNYTAGDILLVERAGDTIYFKRNDTILYASTNTISNTQSLMIDVSIYSQDGTIQNAQIYELPEPASNLTSDAKNSEVDLTWDASPSYTVGYKIHYGTSPGVYNEVIDAGDVLSYSITGLQNSTDYYFVVTAYNHNGDSQYSNEVTALCGNEVDYSYDNRNRLQSVVDGNVSIEYQYDSVGNITNKVVF